MKAGVFFERNGILNVVQEVNNHACPPLSLEQFRINETARAAISRLKAGGFILIATVNQPELSQGAICRRDLDCMHEILKKTFDLNDVLVCPHDEADHCPCRKPKPGLFTEAAFKWHLNLDRSYVISDKWPDAEAARAVGATSLLLESRWNGSGHHDFILPTLDEIVAKIEKLEAALSAGPRKRESTAR